MFMRTAIDIRYSIAVLKNNTRSHFKTHFEIYNQLNLLIPIFRNRGFEIASNNNLPAFDQSSYHGY
jgi:hypothetical protein